GAFCVLPLCAGNQSIIAAANGKGEKKMKVTEVKIYVVDTGSFRPVITEIITDEGLTGVGEGAVGFGVGCYAAAKMAEELAEQFVVGKDPGEIQSIWNDFYYDTFWGK